MFTVIINGKVCDTIDKETAMIIVFIYKNAGIWHIQYEDSDPELYYDICFTDYKNSIRIREEG